MCAKGRNVWERKMTEREIVGMRNASFLSVWILVMANEYCIIELQRYTFHLISHLYKTGEPSDRNQRVALRRMNHVLENTMSLYHSLGCFSSCLIFGNSAKGMRLKAVMSQVQKQSNN